MIDALPLSAGVRENAKAVYALIAQAESAGVLTPLPIGEINTQNGTYLAEIDDLTTAVEGGYFNTKLYRPDYYAADRVTALQAGDKVQLMGFGTFEVKERAARVGRKPSTGETIEIPAKKSPAFKAGKGFKDQF